MVTAKAIAKPEKGSAIVLRGGDGVVTTAAASDQSEGASVAGVEDDTLQAARASLKARAGAKGRRGGKAGRGGTGPAQVKEVDGTPISIHPRSCA